MMHADVERTQTTVQAKDATNKKGVLEPSASPSPSSPPDAATGEPAGTAAPSSPDLFGPDSEDET